MSAFHLVAMSDGSSWHPGIGDPTFVGWLTVVAYGVAAVLCFREWRREQDEPPRYWFWAILTVLMVLLGINKQLDLQTGFTYLGRNMARSEGWYDRRRSVQFVFILLVIITGAAGFTAIWKLVRGHGRDLWLALLGIFTVICFVVIRATSFHHIDEFLGTRLAGFKMNWILELGGISLIIAGALKQSSPEVGPECRQDA